MDSVLTKKMLSSILIAHPNSESLETLIDDLRDGHSVNETQSVENVAWVTIENITDTSSICRIINRHRYLKGGDPVVIIELASTFVAHNTLDVAISILNNKSTF